jgi:Tol biopolymer transport system component
MDLGGTGRRNLTGFEDSGFFAPSWSPDGTHIAFYDEDGLTGVIGGGGNDLVRFSDCRPVADTPQWSPDSNRLLCHSEAARSLVSIRADGSAPIRLAPDSLLGTAAWSPDGTRVALYHQSTATEELLAVSSDGTGSPQRLAQIPLFGGLLLWPTPVWSPTGQQIAFFREASDANFTIDTSAYVINTDGTGFKRVGPAVSPPAWSPDGTSLLFAAGNVIYVSDAAGGNVRELTRCEACSSVGWSPDGTAILLGPTDVQGPNVVPGPGGGNSSDLYVAHADGSGLIRLTVDSVRGVGSWSR